MPAPDIFSKIKSKLKTSANAVLPDKGWQDAQNEAQDTIDRNGVAATGGVSSQTKILRYPENLGDEENPHYVMFFVNIPEARVEAQSIAKSDRVYYDASKENRISIESNEEAAYMMGNGGGIVGAVAGGAYGVGVAAKTGRSALGRLAKAVPSALAMGAAGFGAGKVAGNKFQNSGLGIEPTKLVHMPISIALQIQNKPSASYSAEWADQEMGMFGNMATGVSMRDIAKYGTRDALMALASLPKLAGMGVDFRALTQKGERRIKNPQKEQLFKSMGFREFSYEHHFLPRSLAEAQMVFEIIKTFKQYMHPELDPKGKLFLHYPAEWNIIHYYKDTENQYLHKISSCALKDVSVAYGGNEFTTFQGTEGMPSEIYLTLKFVELEILTSNKIQQNPVGGF